ncbi:MAG: hypothetical protein IR164_00220 [Devosia sp.]|jgi:hypothetical protein|uniref:hypothetical protein n=1 Tax=unclassified Devosia TaxID=196773 RepID=UPI0019E89D0F|nr:MULTISPECIES: hypothetical protein [unclassified Devosia]MBF0677343.1 hypothetical protein [Devosia sp.]WEJ33405.1 hypothetical protein NYQ88_00855 [Devosia sp. SD17-2]
MTNKLLGAVAALTLFAAVSPAIAQDVEFTLINNSSHTLTYLYVAPSNTEDWGDDLLGEKGILEAGYEASVFIGDGSDQCLYDLRFETAEGAELDVYEVDICSLGSYTLTD